MKVVNPFGLLQATPQRFRHSATVTLRSEREELVELITAAGSGSLMRGWRLGMRKISGKWWGNGEMMGEIHEVYGKMSRKYLGLMGDS